jgi:sec-independent protein translocase protein TatA
LRPGKETNVGGFSAWHWIIVALVVLVLFGRGKISETMGDFGKGIKSFKKGLGEDETRPQQQTPPPPAPQIAPPPSEQPAAAAEPAAATTDISKST